MYARTTTALALTVLVMACERTPTTVEPALQPQFAGQGSPRFTDASATGPGNAGELLISFSMSGVGSKASDFVTGAADQDGTWACRTSVGEFDYFPAPQVVTGRPANTVNMLSKNGQPSGSITLNAPPNALTCPPGAPGIHAPVLVSVQYSGVQVSNPDAGSVAIPGIFQRSFFTLPTDVVPTFTAFTPAATNFTIDGAGVSYSATIQNDGSPLSGIIAQLWVTQGTTFRAAGGASVDCGGALGDLPTGSCTITGTAFANNGGAGAGTLTAGAAVLELDLRMSPGVRVLAGQRVNVTLQ